MLPLHHLMKSLVKNYKPLVKGDSCSRKFAKQQIYIQLHIVCGLC